MNIALVHFKMYFDVIITVRSNLSHRQSISQLYFRSMQKYNYAINYVVQSYDKRRLIKIDSITIKDYNGKLKSNVLACIFQDAALPRIGNY